MFSDRSRYPFLSQNVKPIERSSIFPPPSRPLLDVEPPHWKDKESADNSFQQPEIFDWNRKLKQNIPLYAIEKTQDDIYNVISNDNRQFFLLPMIIAEVDQFARHKMQKRKIQIHDIKIIDKNFAIVLGKDITSDKLVTFNVDRISQVHYNETFTFLKDVSIKLQGVGNFTTRA